MTIVAWDDSYRVGVELFDLQHEKLVRILNELHHAMDRQENRQAQADLLDEFLTYATVHFAAEEKYLRENGYPDYATHRGEHNQFKTQLIDFKSRFDTGQTAMTVSIMQFLKQWLVEHILSADKAYGEYFTPVTAQ